MLARKIIVHHGAEMPVCAACSIPAGTQPARRKSARGFGSASDALLIVAPTTVEKARFFFREPASDEPL
jgi:hypothetical protein